MGMLDDLRKQSNELKAKEEQDNERRANAEKIYREEVQPKLSELYQHLKELTDHLNYLKPNTIASYKINADGKQLDFLQGEYSVSIDSTSDTSLVALRATCNFPKRIEFMVRESNHIAKHTDYLNQNNLQFEYRRQSNDRGEVVGAYFKVKPQVPIEFLFRGDRENACINLVVLNFEVLGRTSYVLKAEQLSEQFIDDFDHYLVREKTGIFQFSMDDKLKEELRAKIQLEQKLRKEEMEEAERLEKEELEKQKQENEGKGLGLLKKIPKSISSEKFFGKFNKKES